MNNLETIENYLTGQLAPADRTRFEATLRTDPALAESLAFYVQTKHVVRAEARKERKAELDALRQTPRQQPVPMRWVAAASVLLLLGLGWLIFRLDNEVPTTAQLTDTYLADTYGQLGTTMSGGTTGTLEQGIDLYNRQQYAEAEAIFTRELNRQTNRSRRSSGSTLKGGLGLASGSDRLLKFTGLAAFQQQKYDVAIKRFQQLGQRTDLFSNPGLFLEALARLKRNEPMDKEQAKKLLGTVINRNLEGKKAAEQLIETL